MPTRISSIDGGGTRGLFPAALLQQNEMRVNAYYKDESVPEVLRNRKSKIDVTVKEQLDTIKSYADETYTLKKAEFISFIQTP